MDTGERCARGRWPWQVLLPFAVFVLHSLPLVGWLVDDAGISLVYARNLVRGYGLVAQAGAEPVEGFSNPLWTFLLAPVFLLDPADPTPAVKIISLLLVLGTFFTVDRIVRTLLPDGSWAWLASLGSLLLLAVNTSFVAWTNSGLENPLYVLLIALYCLLCIRYAAGEAATAAKTATWVGLAAAGVALTRPEGLAYLVVLPAVAAVRLLADRSRWRSEGRSLAVFWLAALPPILLYLAFRYAYFGDLVPNTYHAKGGPTLGELGRLLRLASEYRIGTHKLLVSMFGGQAGWLMVLLPALAAYVALASPRRRMFLVVSVMLLCSWAIYCLLPLDWMGEYRFATPFFVLFYVLLVAAGAEVLRVLPTGSPRVRKIVFAACLAAIVAQSAVIYVPRTRTFAASPTGPFATVARTVGRTFNDYAVALGIADGSLLCPDVGGAYYTSRLRIYDLGGLCDRTIARFLDRDRAALTDYVLGQLRPTFISIHDSWCERTGLQRDARFWALYTPIRQTPCEWAQEQGEPEGLFDGHYVRKDAVRSPERLAELRRRLGEHADDRLAARVWSGQPRP